MKKKFPAWPELLFLVIVLLCSQIQAQGAPSQENQSQKARYLIPKQGAEETTPPAPKPKERSSYESLTENRGSFQILPNPEDEQEEQEEEEQPAPPAQQTQGPLINFNNVSITEVLKYVSRLTGKNFVYDPLELQFNITMISDSSSSLEEILAMVIQSLRAHGYLVIEEGGSYIVHTNPSVRGAAVLDEDSESIDGAQIASQVFVLQNIEAGRIAAIIKTMSSDSAIVEAVGESSIIVSDIAENIKRISIIIKELDSQTSGLEIGQYVSVNTSPATLVSLAERVVAPLASKKPLVLVPHAASNSVFIVSTPILIQRTLSVMQSVDLDKSHSGVFSKEGYKFDPEASEEARRRRARDEGEDEESTLEMLREAKLSELTEDRVRTRLLEQGLDFEFVDSLDFEQAQKILKQSQRKRYTESELPVGTVEATQFLIHRLQYRKSVDVAKALTAIAESLSGGDGNVNVNPEVANSDLIITLNSVQAVDDNNTIVFTGTRASLKKVKQLINQIDLPVRQVFIEALVLDTSLGNSLQFGVEWSGKIERTNSASQLGFRRSNSTFGTAFDAITIDDSGAFTPTALTPPGAPAGISIGNLGRKIKFLGRGFRSTGALIQALHADDETHVMLNPQIVTEHNVPAEIFVGEQTPIKGQSIANTSVGGGNTTDNLVTTNYEIQETGVSLKVTPLISSHDTVTLILEQKVSIASAEEVQAQAGAEAPPATVREARTTTRIHMPSDHFLVMSGMIRESTRLQADKIPCLGGLPLVGSLFGAQTKSYGKRNLMIFIRPIIMDTNEDIDELTRRREEILKAKSTVQSGYNKQIDDLQMMLNLR